MHPRARLIDGPAIAIQNSDFALTGSCSSSATPPNKNSVIPPTFKPNLRAASEWESSCKMSDANRPSILRTDSQI